MYSDGSRSRRISHCSVPAQLIDIIETVYRGASKGRGLVVSPKGKSTASLWKFMLLIPLDRLLHQIPLLEASHSFGRSLAALWSYCQD